MYLKFVEVARKGLDSAKEVFAVLSEKYKQAKNGLDKLLSGIITTARAEGMNRALNEFQSDINSSSQDAGMQNDGLLADDGVLTEMPSPENVSIDGNAAGNEGNPLAQPDGSVIMDEGTQGEDGDRAEDSGKPGGQAAGARDFIDGFEIIDGKVGGKIPVDEFIKYRQASIINPEADIFTFGKYTPTVENGVEDWTIPGPDSYIVRAGRIHRILVWGVTGQKYRRCII